jgi:predicted ATPase
VLEAAGQALAARDGLAEYIADRSLLLLRQLRAGRRGGRWCCRLLASCPTSISRHEQGAAAPPGEQEYPVPPLSHEEGVGFFLARARAIKPDFAPDDSVSAISTRLDDLPLALELAAARVKALSSAQILERLDERLPLLTGGARDAPERQRTLRATIEWSYGCSPEANFARRCLAAPPRRRGR